MDQNDIDVTKWKQMGSDPTVILSGKGTAAAARCKSADVAELVLNRVQQHADLALIHDYAASSWCEQACSKKWVDLDATERDFWRNEVTTAAKEWTAELADYAEQQASSPSP